jgi:hypothetical protein
MRSLGILGVLCFVAVPAFAAPVLYTFNSTAGGVVLNVQGQGSTASGLAGTFTMAIDAGNGHIGAGDTFVLGAAGLTNTGTLKLGLAGIATATLAPGGAKFLSFAQAAPGVVPTSVVNSDVYLSATIFVTGLTSTTFKATTWAGTLLPFTVNVSTSAAQSDIIYSSIAGTFGYAVGITDVALTLTLDLVINIEGTAHAIPDPALGGLTALGLGGAGAWLRRRRS